MVKYDYTAYGTINSITGTLSSTIGQYNPFRYKGYYYDTETKMYYCKSRYYVPEWCRWLNGDHVGYLDLEDIDGMNLFAYCGNNPISYIDEEGNFIGIGFGIAIGLAALFAAATAATVVASEVSKSIDVNIDTGIRSSRDFVKGLVAGTMFTSIPYIASIVMDNVRMSKTPRGNWKETKNSNDEEDLSEEALQKAYNEARKKGDQAAANKIKLTQKILGLRNKQKRNKKKPKGSKWKIFIIALLTQDIVRRF